MPAPTNFYSLLCYKSQLAQKERKCVRTETKLSLFTVGMTFHRASPVAHSQWGEGRLQLVSAVSTQQYTLHRAESTTHKPEVHLTNQTSMGLCLPRKGILPYSIKMCHELARYSPCQCRKTQSMYKEIILLHERAQKEG